MPPRRTMETAPIKFGDFFEGEAKYQVPLFQRDYNWKKDHIEEFWDDLWKHWDDWRNRREERIPYYFGSVMLVNEDERNFRFKVVDGQQRMTTSMVFFIALRDFFLEVGDDDEVKELNSIIFYEDEEGELKPRMQLNRYNNPYFSTKMIEQKKITEKMNSIGRDIRVKNKSLAECYKQISLKLLDEDGTVFGGITLEDKSNDIRDLYEHLLKYFEVVENIFSSKQRAYRIFETINHKGLRLNENDLVKNYLMELIDDTGTIDESQDVINADSQWGDIVSKLEFIKMKEDAFLRAHLTAFVGRTPKDKIYERIMGIVGDKTEAQSFLVELEESVDFLSKIKNPTGEDWNSDDEVLDNLEGLDAISDGGFYPILLGAKNRLGFQEMKKLIQLVTKLHFRAKTVCGASFTEIEGLVLKICTELKNSTSYSIPDIITHMTSWSKYPDDDEFSLKFKQLELSSSPKARYVLKEIEYSMISGGRSMSSSRIVSDIQIEHIMPKTIQDSEWENLIGARPELNTPAEISDYHKRNLNRLGNLTLLGPQPNAILQNDAYLKKLNGTGAYSGYRDDQMKMTSRLIDYQTWGEEEITIRQEVFLRNALNIWNLNSS